MPDVQISWFNPTTGSREARALIADAAPCGLWRRHGLVFVAAQVGGSGGEWHVWRSGDDGRTVSQITAMTIWNPATHKNAHVASLEFGGAGSIATVRDSDPLQVVFKASTDGIAWPVDTDAIDVGEYSGTARVFQLFSEIERHAIIASNGIDAAWRSYDNGASWTAI